MAPAAPLIKSTKTVSRMLGRRESEGSAGAIFRIVQAGLRNGARHAHASRALMALMKRKNGLILTVTDNRKGIIRKPIYGHDLLGITGIGPGSLGGPPLVPHATLT
jgi:signal transduction histidine kinase